MQQIEEIKEYVSQVRSAFVTAGAFSLVVNLLMLVPSLYMLQVYDRVLTSRNIDTLLLLTLIVLGLYVVLTVVEWVRSQLLANAAVELDLLMAPRLFDAFIRHRAESKGTSADSAFADATTLRQFISGQSLVALFDAPWVPIFVAVIYLIHPGLAAVAVVGALLLVFIAWLGQVLTHQEAERSALQQSAAVSTALGFGRNHEPVLAMGMVPRVRARWLHMQSQATQLLARVNRKAGMLGSTGRLVRLVQQTAVLGIGAWLAVRGDISPGGMIAASILMTRALAPLDLAIGSWRQFHGARAAYRRLGLLLAREPAEREKLALPDPTGEVSVEGVSVVPPGSAEPVLLDVSFRIRAGMAIGVVGPSGSGKSCLARVLMGIWTPARGAVRLDGASLADWDRESLGRHVGYLPQSVDLLDGTVAENICRFGTLDSARTVEAARLAGIHELIMRLPHGYETPVGVDGVNLSGGQRQRLALARAVYGKPRWVVLDEPNANLDDQGEAALVSALSELKSWGATVVVITHRRSLLQAMDGVLVLRDGRLVVYGPAAEVLKPAPAVPGPRNAGGGA